MGKVGASKEQGISFVLRKTDAGFAVAVPNIPLVKEGPDVAVLIEELTDQVENNIAHAASLGISRQEILSKLEGSARSDNLGKRLIRSFAFTFVRSFAVILSFVCVIYLLAQFISPYGVVYRLIEKVAVKLEDASAEQITGLRRNIQIIKKEFIKSTD